MNNIDQWKQANDTLRDIEKELRQAQEGGDVKREAWMLREKRECNALIARLEKGTKEEQA
tara:strand:+ start:245 stop:424 length:180 start_codon:yes stop_codon:yes gene_type:complete